MLMQTGRHTKSSYAKLLMPMKEVGADVDPVDAIGGGTYVTSAVSLGDGTEITFTANNAATLGGGNLPVITAKDSFIVMQTLGAFNSGVFDYGDTALNSSLSFAGNFGAPTASIKFNDNVSRALTGVTTNGTTAIQSIAFVVDRVTRTVTLYRDGIIASNVLAIPESLDNTSFNHNASNLRLNSFEGYGLETFVFAGVGLPNDTIPALIDMAARRANGDMRIYAPWELK